APVALERVWSVATKSMQRSGHRGTFRRGRQLASLTFRAHPVSPAHFLCPKTTNLPLLRQCTSDQFANGTSCLSLHCSNFLGEMAITSGKTFSAALHQFSHP